MRSLPYGPGAGILKEKRKTRKPLIGITPLFDVERDHGWMLPGYMQGIEEAGGAPVMLPLCTDRASLERLAKGLDGLLQRGGHCQRPADSLPLPRTVDCLAYQHHSGDDSR